MDWNDLFYKTVWTAVSAVLGVLVVAVADAPYGWAPFAVAAINALTVWVRQRTGTTQPAG